MLITANPIEHLQSHGIKPSPQRIAVMDYLLNSRMHPTADEIYLALSPSMPTLSKTTVYNTLKLLVEAGAVLDLYPEQVPYLEQIDRQQLGRLRIVQTRLYYIGYCEQCQEHTSN